MCRVEDLQLVYYRRLSRVTAADLSLMQSHFGVQPDGFILAEDLCATIFREIARLQDASNDQEQRSDGTTIDVERRQRKGGEQSIQR